MNSLVTVGDRLGEVESEESREREVDREGVWEGVEEVEKEGVEVSYAV